MRSLRALAALAALVAAGPGMAVLTARTASADTQVCDKFGSTSIAGGRYIVQNNEWGDSIPQCINVTASGFSVTTGNHNVPTNGAPAAYPSIYAGCHYGNCSSGSGLPLRVSSFGNPRTTVSYNTTSGQWDAAYDIWYDPTPNPPGQNTGAELMIWGSHSGAPQPVGSKVASVNLAGATWDVWFGNTGWNVVSYVRQQPTNGLDVGIKDFTTDAVNRGYVQNSWYLTSVQFGFEPWQGGPGLGVNSFSFTA
jgi:hypothetical protein